MALSGTTIFEVRGATGSDTNCGGAFDPGQTAGMFTDGAASSATGATPSFTSASYSFVAGDAGAWLYIASGTHWQPGWYQIGSVSGGAAILSAAVGAAIWGALYGTTTSLKVPVQASTVAGCSSDGTSSLTGATWTIDYSQQAAAQITYTDLASSGTGLTVSSAGNPFAKQHVGNSIVITGGTNFNTGRYVIASVAAGVATVVGPTNITTGAGASGTGKLGGALATIQKALDIVQARNITYVKADGTYSISTALTEVTDCTDFNGRTRLVGYTSLRTDLGQTTVQTSAAVNAIKPKSTGFQVENFILDGNSTGIVGLSKTATYEVYASNVKCMRFTSHGFVNIHTVGCEAASNGGAGFSATVGGFIAYGCTSRSNGSNGFEISYVCRCLSYSNSGKGISNPTSACENTVHGNTGDGIGGFTYGSIYQTIVVGNILTNNGGYGLNQNLQSTTISPLIDYNFFGGGASINTLGARNAVAPGPHDVTLTGDPYVDATNKDLALNNIAGCGAAVRAAGFPGLFPAGLTRGYLDGGAVQHADPASYPTILRRGGVLMKM